MLLYDHGGMIDGGGTYLAVDKAPNASKHPAAQDLTIVVLGSNLLRMIATAAEGELCCCCGVQVDCVCEGNTTTVQYLVFFC